MNKISHLRFFVAVFSLFALACGAALADEASVKKELEARFPGLKIDRITKTNMLDLYEVVSGKEVVYTDDKATYLFSGNLIEVKTRKNITQERVEQLTAVNFKDLPFELAIKTVRGKGTRQVAMFSDPNCPYCKRMDKAVMDMDDITIYTFLYPILAADSAEKAKMIWCAPDKSRAYMDWMLRGRSPAVGKDCDAPINRMVELGRRLGMDSVPVTIMTSGQRIVGARVEDLQRLMQTASAK